jgi:hypothetical protein
METASGTNGPGGAFRAARKMAISPGQLPDLIPDRAKRLRTMLESPESEGQLDHRANLMQLELEFGHYPEVAAAASHGPEQLWARLRRSTDDVPRPPSRARPTGDCHGSDQPYGSASPGRRRGSSRPRRYG